MYLKSFSSLDIGLYLTEEWNKKKSSDLVVNPFLDHLVLGLAKHKLVFFFFSFSFRYNCFYFNFFSQLF